VKILKKDNSNGKEREELLHTTKEGKNEKTNRGRNLKQ